MSGLGGWWHLARRFLEVLIARPLSSLARREASSLLRSETEQKLFFGQPAADQQHGLAAARIITGRIELQRAALLHDVGKQQAALGVWARSLASVLAKLHITVHGRFELYLDHGSAGAAMLQELGAEALVTDFARHHHADRPATITPEDWAALQHADRKAQTLWPMAIR